MTESVKPRSYDNSRREARARATRARVVEAARALFVDRGYLATSIEAIGTAADVPLATLYRLFGTKRAILSAVLEVAFVGDDQPIALHDRPEIKALRDEPDARLFLAGFARLTREVLDRSGALQQVLRDAAQVDPEAAELLAAINGQRYTGQANVARGLVARDALADGITETHAHDTIYVLMSPEVRQILTVDREWTADQYEQWLRDTLCATLLGRERRSSP